MATSDVRAGSRADALQRHPAVREVMAGSRFLRALQPSTIRTLLESASLRRADAGRLVQPENVSLGSLLIVVDGIAKVHHVLRSGQEHLIRIVGPGDLVNGPSATAGTTRAPAVTALTDCILLAIQIDVLHRDLPVRGDLGSALSAELAALMNGHVQDDVAMAELDTTGRVAYRLAQLARRWSTRVDGGLAIVVPLTQEEIAAWSVASRESVAKALHRLRNDGVVSTGRRFLMVRDLEALDALAGIETIDLTVVEQSA